MAAALAALSLAGCATRAQGPAFDPEALIPAALTTCEDAPAVPARPADGASRSDTVVASYIVDLRGAYKDCKGTVAAIKVRRDLLDAQAKAAKPRRGLSLPHIHIHIPFTKSAPKPAQ